MAYGVLVLPILILIIPVVLLIDKEKLRTYNVFLQIPVPIIKQLSNRSIKGVELLQNQIFEDGKDTNETDVDEVENGVAAAFDWSAVNLSNFKTRKAQRDFCWAFGLIVLLGLPLLVCLLYVYLIGAYSASVQKTLEYDHTAMYVSEQRTAFAQIAELLTVQALLTTDDVQAAAYAAQSAHALESLSAVESLIFLAPAGTGFASAIDNSAQERELMLTNGCLGSTNVAECSSVLNGLFNKGLHAVVQSFVSSVQELMASRITNTASWTPLQRINDPRWQNLELMSYYLNQGLLAADTYRQQAITGFGSSFKSTLSAIEACFVLAIILTFIFLYLPTIRRLDAMLKTARSTLLLFPSDVVMAVPVIQAAMKTYAKKAHRKN